MSTFIKANLVSLRTIDVMVFTDIYMDNRIPFNLYIDDKYAYSPTVIRRTTNREVYLFRLELKEQFDFSKRYFISFLTFPIELVDVSNATEFKEFEDMFYYDGDDLGCHYSKEETSFAVWAPLSPCVKLKLESMYGNLNEINMIRDSHGVYRLTLKGDYKNRRYHYVIENNGIIRETNDIYGKAVTLNSEYSVVVDMDELNEIKKVECQSSSLKPVDSLIYEVSVRDFTEDKNTDIVEKGKYLGFVEEGRKTKKGNPAGLDYLSYLGITHVQLMPIHDVNNVDDVEVSKKYNWGYDPVSYFTLEGAYSSHPEDPISRLKEFKTMVSKLHERNIAVNIDVVYNHVYEWFYTSFEKIVPGYYFRKKKNGELSSCSGCGNDFASEKKMVRKLIVDSIVYLFKEFDIDGLRFDLMGLLDIDTMLAIERAVKQIKPHAMLYGEGWNMGLQIPFENRACAENANKLMGYGFFNDMYRDIIKGPTFNVQEKGFINGNLDYYFGLEYIMNGSVLDLSYNHRFLDANQSLNYAECHDNNTLFDKLLQSNSDEDVDSLCRRVRMANDLILLSFGMPFIHMGQEIGQSKQGHDNTYNVVKINNMKWDLVDERFSMVERLKTMFNIRKNILKFLSLSKPEDIKGVYKFNKEESRFVTITINSGLIPDKYHDMKILINNGMNKAVYCDDSYYSLLGLEETNVKFKNIIVPPLSVNIIYK